MQETEQLAAKRRSTELIRLLQADQSNPALAWCLELLEMEARQAAEALVSCPPEGFLQTQGKVQALRALKRRLLDKTPNAREN